MTALRHWPWTRWLRLGIGLAFIGQGFASSEAFALGAGAFFSMQAILNTGCCFVGSCTPVPAREPINDNELTYHEVK
ncbi:MAG: hypothetical protein IPM12_08015 [Flavobacteriales bacterium]|nr:hypothetical protein [Flavobacteriales bacterium]